MKMVRVLINSVVEGVIKRFSGSGRSGETFTSREFFQQYGFTSRPLMGAEGILIKDGNVLYLVASDDRRYRLQILDGEVALYTDQGDKVHLARGQVIVKSGGKVHVEAPLIEALATTKISLTAPVVEVSQNLTVGGSMNATGTITSATSIADPTGTMAAMRSAYNGHTHTDPQGGVTGGPSAGM